MAGDTSSATLVTTNDVFLSFRGVDTRNGFTSHLYDALRGSGVATFMDEEGLDVGQDISPTLIQNIEGSRIAVVVLSENYASSRWCLDELSKIVECKEKRGTSVWPVFYGIDPTAVRHQTGRYGEALSRHVERGAEAERVAAWRSALAVVGSISGWHLVNQRESRIVQEIVGRALYKVKSNQLHFGTTLIGMDYHLGVMLRLLNLQASDVQMVGICGIGGIGKTTVAKAVYNATAGHFEQCCFLANVRETCEKSSHFGLLQLQEILLSRLKFDNDLQIDSVDIGINIMKRKLSSKKVLIVIDDSDHLNQLKTLAGECDWFGPGSRIIITTRDEHLLDVHGVRIIYKIKELAYQHALQLFKFTVFHGRHPDNDYGMLTSEVVKYTKGLPLAIKVIGSFLFGRSPDEWKSTLEKLKRAPNGEVFDVLKVSFDGLDDSQKSIFLDIACFFKGENLAHVKEILKSCYHSPEIDIRVLVEKSLVFIEYDRLEMHDMIQAMGKEIVRRESPGEPGERSRLWSLEDVLTVLEEGSGTSKIEGIKLVLAAPEEPLFDAQVFANMKKLRFFIARNVVYSGDHIYFPNDLRWLDWLGYGSSCLPFNVGLKKLVRLCMSRSRIKIVGNEFKSFRNLKSIDFSHCEQLTEIPDVSSMPNLESLDLSECTSLVEVHESLGTLNKLVHLDFLNCRSLSRFPSFLRSEYLQNLVLGGCSKLREFPDIQAVVKGLKVLSLQGTAIRGLPLSVGNFIGLEQLSLLNDPFLEIIPSSIYSLQHLERMSLRGCSQLKDFPKCPGACSSFSLSSGLCNVVHLDLAQCGLLEAEFLEDLRCFSMLTMLDLSGNRFVTLPTCIRQFTGLQQLNLARCKELREIQELPPFLSCLFAEGCESLERCVDLSSMLTCHPDQSPWTRLINFLGCHKLTSNHCSSVNDILSIKDSLGDSRVSIIIPGSEIPMWFSRQSQEFFIGFFVDWELYEDIAGVAFCSVLRPVEQKNAAVMCEVQLFVNAQETFGFVESFSSLESDHVWLLYVPSRMMWDLESKLGNNSRSEFLVVFQSSPTSLKSFGVHLILKKGRQQKRSKLLDTETGMQSFGQSPHEMNLDSKMDD